MRVNLLGPDYKLAKLRLPVTPAGNDAAGCMHRTTSAKQTAARKVRLNLSDEVFPSRALSTYMRRSKAEDARESEK